MFVLDSRYERLAIFFLTVLMAVTRIEHFGINQIAPDASTAVFFLAGLLIGNPLWLIAFLVEALALDATAIKVVGVDPVCVTFGYFMMIPAYASLWLAPRLLRDSFKLDIVSFGKLALACIAGTACFFLFSNIGYYIGGGFDNSMGLAEYTRRVVRYFPHYLTITLLYGAAGVAISVVALRFFAPKQLAAR